MKENKEETLEQILKEAEVIYFKQSYGYLTERITNIKEYEVETLVTHATKLSTNETKEVDPTNSKNSIHDYGKLWFLSVEALVESVLEDKRKKRKHLENTLRGIIRKLSEVELDIIEFKEKHNL